MQIPQVSAGVFQSFYANRQNYKENLKLSEQLFPSSEQILLKEEEMSLLIHLKIIRQQ